jgi:ApaG protein
MSLLPTYTETTNFIRVTVYPVYLESQSLPDENHYLWAYHVKIENMRDHPVQLKSRYWKITDSLGRIHEVRGDGVVGEQPVIPPGEIYEYTSGTPLATPSGVMMGMYHMEEIDGEAFDVRIPAFSLDSPHEKVSLN